MRYICEHNVLLESKEVIKEYATDVINYGSKNSIFAVAEESQSFRKQIVEYVLVFRTEHGIKNFKVNKQIYDSNEEGTVGNLYYNKHNFHKFERTHSK